MRSATHRYLSGIAVGIPAAALVIGAMAVAIMVEEVSFPEPTR